MNHYQPAAQPTLYFIGVTTGSSSIMNIFPKWEKELGLNDVQIKGIDFPLHASADAYQSAVAFIKSDPLSLGALVTTHKIDLFNSCRNMFEYIDPYAEQLGEVSSISKMGNHLCAHAKDPISSGLAMESFLPADFWKSYGGDVLLLGAGGSSLAMSVYLTQDKFKSNVPKRIILANRSKPRLEQAKKILADLNPLTEFIFVHNPTPACNDVTLSALKPHSLIVNATGLGKDAPGSPLTNACSFPLDSFVWEINYRGNLIFKDQALAQAENRRLHVEDGWTYFIHGWTQVIAEIFHITINPYTLEHLSEIALDYNKQEACI